MRLGVALVDASTRHIATNMSGVRAEVRVWRQRFGVGGFATSTDPHDLMIGGGY